ncbi:MAG: hypothetical protein IJK62_14950 [Bacteroidales bacterium]|nr:hypothetical protein [Bacteroidales bacterium]
MEKSKFSFWGTAIKLMLVIWPWLIVVMQAVQVFSSESVLLTINELLKSHIAAIVGSFAGAVAATFLIKKIESNK